jgi:hypothetical protein
MTATVHTLDFTDPPPAGRRECDDCGDWHTELRLVSGQGWTLDTDICRECWTHPEMDFTDLPIVQEAMRHV